jgi:lipopolysaccharide/colanic/teichoic acid biosynthesis glycosyltransferase
LKRFFDILASLAGLLILSPIFLVIAVLLAVMNPVPVLFRQVRTGKHGKPFTIIKFRTMYVDHGGSPISIKGEKRITPLGAVLRKYKLDELPELWNVLKGDMSFVGPRPDVPEYTGRLSGEELKILELRPGITSPASLKYSNEEEILAKTENPEQYYNEIIWPDKVRMNLEYYSDRSFTGDIKIIIQTIFRRSVISTNKAI